MIQTDQSSLCLQPVGFVTFSSRSAAEAAKQDLQVIYKFFFNDFLTFTGKCLSFQPGKVNHFPLV